MEARVVPSSFSSSSSSSSSSPNKTSPVFSNLPSFLTIVHPVYSTAVVEKLLALPFPEVPAVAASATPIWNKRSASTSTAADGRGSFGGMETVKKSHAAWTYGCICIGRVGFHASAA